jgi:hypothetical protein
MPPSNEVSRFAHWSDPSRNSISSLCGEASEWAVSCTGRCPEMRIDVLIHRHWYMAVYGSSERPTKRKGDSHERRDCACWVRVSQVWREPD